MKGARMYNMYMISSVGQYHNIIVYHDIYFQEPISAYGTYRLMGSCSDVILNISYCISVILCNLYIYVIPWQKWSTLIISFLKKHIASFFYSTTTAMDIMMFSNIMMFVSKGSIQCIIGRKLWYHPALMIRLLKCCLQCWH